jgi:hypothetical protein
MTNHDDGNPENQSVSLLNNPNEFYYEHCPKCNRDTKTATTEIGYYSSTHRCLECGCVSEVKNKHKR